MACGEEAAHVLRSIAFSFYTAEEVRSMSVKRITSPIVQDSLGKNVRNGLYDPALGPTEKNDQCETCGESYINCFGHFGHIDLVMPVYNPLLYRPLLKLVKNMCLSCHHFRHDRKRIEDAYESYMTIMKDTVCENAKVPDSVTSGQFIQLKKIIDELFSSPKTQCMNCRAQCHGVKSEGHGKMFQQPLSAKKKKDTVLAASAKKSKKKEDSIIAMATQGSGIYFTEPKIMLPSEVKEHMQLLWKHEKAICDLFWGGNRSKQNQKLSQKGDGSEVFFLDTLAVTPSRFRPPNRVNNQLMEHQQNLLFGKVINANLELSDYIASQGDETEKGLKLWLALQNAVNELIDSTTASGKDRNVGIRQLLEKKQGMFRWSMMGKRVDHTCRSVISPDPYIAVDEIGIPPNFAIKLTYPERVTPWNYERLRENVENGPFVHPGATHVVDEHGNKIGLEHVKPHQRTALAKTLLSTPSTTGDCSESGKLAGKVVYRHLQDGDILLCNRQPTLHKPGIMGHKARVIKGQRALRMHYANCNTYNADFDGDEMNVHFPQDELGRAEAYQIVNANQQFVVPTSGEPIRGLIQDHIVGATLLTKIDTYFTREDYQQLVYTACVPMPSAKSHPRKSAVTIIEDDPFIETVPPAILKPRQLWTGKQVVTTILNYVTRGRPPFSFDKGVRVSGDYIGRNSEDLKVVVRDNELICGIIDKAQFGKNGMVHTVKELYGADDAGHLLSVMSRLFSNYLQMHGFTCGIADLLLVPKADKKRVEILREAEDLGDIIHGRFVGVEDKHQSSIGIEEIKDQTGKLLQKKGEAGRARLDMLMSGGMNAVTSAVNNTLLPNGLLKPFSQNCMCLMTGTGAKGGTVNFTQITTLLGQQELEGKRVPRMASGKTLPCFQPYEPIGRAGGFISDRFLTGLRPQEYYFHCMAGRDGLVDTAVKTAKSGYLQRCIIKNLESLKLCYDYTVRDSDGSVVQFCYGEDGVDVTKSSCLDNFGLLSVNRDLVAQRLGLGESADDIGEVTDPADGYFQDIPPGLRDKFDKYVETLSEEDRRLLKLWKDEDVSDILQLLKHMFFSSLAAPGEPVGVLAGQSIGEPSTQMTLNTFHFAGRGEMNVTLGIPRLHEILTVASKAIKTPIMTCPLIAGKTREDGELLAAKLMKVSLADILESINITIIPFHVAKGAALKVYKVTLKVYPAERFPPQLKLTQAEIEETIKNQFSKQVQKEIDKETKMLTQAKTKSVIQMMDVAQFDGVDDGSSSSRKKKKVVEAGETVEDDEDSDIDAEAEDADAEKRRSRRTDEAAYDSDSDDEEGSLKKELNADEEEEEDDPMEEEGTEAEAEDDGEVHDEKPDIKPRKSSSHGTSYQIKFSTPQDSPQIFLPNIIEKVLRGLNIRRVNRIEKCAVIDVKGDHAKPALQTDGVNMEAMWSVGGEILDLNKLSCNDVNAVLHTYGVEAARATIVSEVQRVFGSYGIAVNVRHLAVIADYMTAQGDYRALNRIGITANPSPFLKMSFETASTFLIDASLRRQEDLLNTPSSRIIVGRPVDLGTGCFDLLQKVDGC